MKTLLVAADDTLDLAKTQLLADAKLETGDQLAANQNLPNAALEELAKTARSIKAVATVTRQLKKR